jgi:hypothetical protein
MTCIQSKKNQLAEYDIVGMLAENLVEVGYVWCVDSGFFNIFTSCRTKVVSRNNEQLLG